MSALLSVEEAMELLIAHQLILASEYASLSDAFGARLAAPVIANLTQPPIAVSAMDGYAVQLRDVRDAGQSLTVIGESAAGAPFEGDVSEGEAVRIFTGAEVPFGADHIVIQEDATRDGNIMMTRRGAEIARHIRRAGIDFSKGDTLLKAGRRLGPAEIAVAAAANHADLMIEKRPVIALLANGDELRPPGSVLTHGQIVSSNSHGLSALVRKMGGEPLDVGIARDSVDDILSKIDAASEADVILPVGGASVGDHDHMRTAFLEAGFEIIFSKIAVRPGKPTWFAKRAEQLVLGLPGNPASAYVCAHLFLPALLTGAGLSYQTAKLGDELPRNGPRTHFIRAALSTDEDGLRTATPLLNQDSSLLTPFLRADCLIERAPSVTASSFGDTVRIVHLKRWA